MARQGLERQIAGIAALEEPARRALYFHVVDRGGAVSRDQAARGTGISRALAAFHLDKLVAAGLLVAEYRRLTGRTGPGAGRPAKLYRRSEEQLAVSLPPRSYALAAELFAEALERGGATARDLGRVARAFGQRLGREIGDRGPRQAGRGRPLDATVAAVELLGFEPAPEGTGVRLRNCPFHALALRHRALVCGANHAMLQGLLSGLGTPGVEAVLDPKPGMCCVAFRRSRKGR
jgi:predicted ArsR family transcriptional regulator